MSGYDLDRDLSFEALEETLGQVIDEPKVADAAVELGLLKLTEDKKDWIEAGRYRDAEEALHKDDPSANEANNRACALAWLAFKERRVDYWDEAIEILEGLKRSGNNDAKSRASFNLDRVMAARTATNA